MKYLKSFKSINEVLNWVGEIMKISDIRHFLDKCDLSEKPVPLNESYLKLITDSFDRYGIEYEILDEKSEWNTKTFAFKKPKKFDKMKFNIHEYDPAEVYYLVRVYQFQYYWGEDEDIFIVQWISKLFAQREHIQNHHDRYPRMGGYTQKEVREDGIYYYNDKLKQWELLYNPPLYKGPGSFFNHHGDTQGEMFACRHTSGLLDLLDEFDTFLMDKDNPTLKLSYPEV